MALDSGIDDPGRASHPLHALVVVHAHLAASAHNE
jgi:hypothetical protein